MSIELARMAPYDLVLYKNSKEVWVRVTSLQKLWKDAKLPILKKEVKKNVVKLINDKFKGVEKHCVFLGDFSVPYTLSRIRKEIEGVMNSVLDKYEIRMVPPSLQKETDENKLYFLPDELDIYFEIKNK